MPNIDANYTSPWARWALLLNDHPDASKTFTVATGDELGIPEQFGGGSKRFCVCTITIPSHPEPHIGWKAPEASKGDSDEWVKVQAKALGRACKNAGYPDNTVDLMATMSWRKGLAELEARRAAAISAAEEPIGEIETAPSRSDDDPVSDEPEADDRYVDPDTGEITEAEVVEPIDAKTVDLAALPLLLNETDMDAYEAAARRAGIDDPYEPASKAEATVLRGLLEEQVAS